MWVEVASLPLEMWRFPLILPDLEVLETAAIGGAGVAKCGDSGRCVAARAVGPAAGPACVAKHSIVGCGRVVLAAMVAALLESAQRSIAVGALREVQIVAACRSNIAVKIAWIVVIARSQSLAPSSLAGEMPRHLAQHGKRRCNCVGRDHRAADAELLMMWESGALHGKGDEREGPRAQDSYARHLESIGALL